MSIHQLKALTWLVALGTGGYLIWLVGDFFQRKTELETSVSTEVQLEILNSVQAPDPPREDVVDYKLVQRTFHGMNWTGKAPPQPVAAPEAEGPQAPPKKPVSELLKVLLIQVDTDAPAGSMAQVTFIDGALAAAARHPDDRVLRVGDALEPPYGSIRVESILPDAVVFSFSDDPDREHERLQPKIFPGERGYIVQTDPATGAILPRRRALPQVAGPSRVPRESMQKGRDIWLVGTDDQDYMAQSYTQILAEIRFLKHRDPRTGEVDGIELKDVPKGSFAAKYGASSGQVIKSINGHPVQSVQEGINFCKQHKDQYDRWVIVYEERGREYVKVVETPRDG